MTAQATGLRTDCPGMLLDRIDGVGRSWDLVTVCPSDVTARNRGRGW
jgi:hypothetical protein